MSTPNYKLPDFIFSNKSYDDFYFDNSTIQNDSDGTFLTLRPLSSWSSTNGYIHFDKLNNENSLFLAHNLDSNFLLKTKDKFNHYALVDFNSVLEEENYSKKVLDFLM